ncbi:malonic semialdehyde reductase [Nocardioides sp. 503]|uniref:malonic semialdehyde reductase n=1 Tax=Nocardioides sp. 503 TaxID=2508326 RepID=UPI0010703976|nr:malonic semialdehyde reductase [Nocardioides sp. 503]
MTVTDHLPTQLEALDERGRALMFTSARTANSFADTPVTDEELTSIWHLTKWGPSAANTQPLRVVFVRTPEGKERLVPLLSEGNRAKTLAAPAVAVLAWDSRFHEHVPTIFPTRPQLQDHFEADEAMRHESGRFSAALQSGVFVMAVRAAGLAAGPMGGFDRDAVDAEFFPDGRFRSMLVVNIGHPSENAWFDRLPRLADEDAVSWA